MNREDEVRSQLHSLIDPDARRDLGALGAVKDLRVDDAGRMGEFNDVICSGIEKKLGIHASPTCQLVFGDADQCEGELIGAEEEVDWRSVAPVRKAKARALVERLRKLQGSSSTRRSRK